MYSYLTAREQKLCRRRAKVEKLLAWKQKLDEEEKEIERLEKEAVQGVASRRASSVNDSIMSGIGYSFVGSFVDIVLSRLAALMKSSQTTVGYC